MLKLLIPDEPRPMTAAERAVLFRCYRALLKERRRAKKEHRQPTDCALLLSALCDVKADSAVVVWMFYQGHVEHMRPKRGSQKGKKVWQVIDSLRFDEASGLVFTAEGEEFAEEFLRNIDSPDKAIREAARAMLITGRLVPRYDEDSRNFTWGCHLLKHYGQRAESQVAVLSWFEESGWSDWLDNSFTGGGRTDPKTRLHDAIKDLNRNQKKFLIRFKGDGTGEKVGWGLR